MQKDQVEEDDIDDFDDCEHTITVACQDINLKRMPCFIHSLMRTLVIFDKDETFKDLKTKVLKIVSFFNKSSKATQLLINKSKLKLVSMSATRWNTFFLVIDRLILLEEEVSNILRELERDDLTNNDWISEAFQRIYWFN